MFKIILIALATFASFSTKAQDVIDDDMLDNIAKNASPLWADKTTAFINNTIPDKYKEESAVVFGYKRNVDRKSVV